MQLIVPSIANRSAAASFAVPIVLFVLAFLAYAALMLAQEASLIPGTRVMPTVLYLVITVARALVATLLVGFMSRFCAKLGGRRAVALTASILAIGIAWETAFPLIKLVASANLLPAVVLLGIAAFGMLTTVVISYFIPYCRKPRVWAIFFLLWTGGAVIPGPPGGYVFVAIRSVALAALGYWLQRAGAARERVAGVFD